MSIETVPEFRAELRAWLHAHLTDDLRREQVAELPEAERIAALRRWQATLAADRWVAITWPVEFGGRGSAAVPRWSDAASGSPNRARRLRR